MFSVLFNFKNLSNHVPSNNTTKELAVIVSSSAPLELRFLILSQNLNPDNRKILNKLSL